MGHRHGSHRNTPLHAGTHGVGVELVAVAPTPTTIKKGCRHSVHESTKKLRKR
jgi:hypothetical protein